jgi:glycosyltransferase involved in cell wall biosynthesis
LPIPSIAFDTTPLQNAHRFRGIGTYVRGLAQRLSTQTDVPIEFWGWQGDDALQPSPPHRALWLPRFPVPQYRGAWLFKRLAMRLRARRSSVRVVHITDPDALTPFDGRTLMATVYDLIPLKQGLGRRRLVARAGYNSYLKALGRVDTLFAISNETARDLVDTLGLAPNRILVVPPGIDLPASQGSGSSHARPYFLFIGGPDPNKNLPVLLSAVAICSELPEVLIIAGHWLPKQVTALNELLSSRGLSGRIRHIGFVPSKELADLMRGATALVVPSRYEGFGLPVGEGLAAGAAVIHSAIPVLEETSSGAALTFNPESAEELAACLRRAATDAELRNELRQRGAQRAQALTWDAAVQTTLTAYHAALSR